MDLNKIMYILFILLLGIFEHSCHNNSKISSSNRELDLFIVKDTIVFSTSKEQYVYLTDRLYPKNDSLLFETSIISVNKVNDTIFVFMNNDIGNYFPVMNDSLFENYYSNYYDIEIDDDIPYFVYLKNSKDNIVIAKDTKYNIFEWDFGIIKDTILNFNEIRINQKKQEILKILNLPEIELQEDDFSIVLCHLAIPIGTWYKDHPEFNKNLLNIDGSYNQISLNFIKGKLKSININAWIGYGEKSRSLF